MKLNFQYWKNYLLFAYLLEGERKKLEKMYQELNEMELKNCDKASKESNAVAVCNGAVYELKFKNVI